MPDNVEHGEGPKHEIQFTPQIIQEQSLQAAHDLMEHMHSSPNLITALSDIITIEALRGNGKKVHSLGETFEDLAKTYPPSMQNEYKASLYLKEVSLGETEYQLSAFDKLQSLLAEEKKKLASDQVSFPRESGLHTVIEGCVELGIPADTWITNNTINKNHADTLKLVYYDRSRKNEDASKAFGKRYLAEVTNRFLHDETIDDSFVWQTAEELLIDNEDPNKKKAIFEKVALIQGNIPQDHPHFETFAHFALTSLRQPDLLNSDDAQWINGVAHTWSTRLLEEDLPAPKKRRIKQAVGTLKIAQARFADEPPKTILQLIDDNLRIQLQDTSADITPLAPGLSITRSSDEYANIRDIELQYGAANATKNGDFAGAKLFIAHIANDVHRASALDSCLKLAKTPETIEALKPDSELLEHEQNLIQIIKLRKVMLGKPNEISKIAASVAEAFDFSSDFRNEFVLQTLLEDSLTATYKHNKNEGTQLAKKLREIIQARQPTTGMIRSMGELQLEQGDRTGLQTLFEDINEKQDPPNQPGEFTLIMYTQVALKAEKLMREKSTT